MRSGASGLRSSCASVARNWSFCAFASRSAASDSSQLGRALVDALLERLVQLRERARLAKQSAKTPILCRRISGLTGFVR